MNTRDTSPSNHGEQRPDIAQKYNTLYRSLAHAAHLILKNKSLSALDNEAKFEVLKSNLEAMWSLLISDTQGQSISWMDLVQQAAARNAMPTSWVEGGSARQGTTQEFRRAQKQAFTRALTTHLPQNCDLVLDLGCGWGHRMFDLWRNGGPPDAFYFGGDNSPSSDEVMAHIRPLFPAMKTAGFPFDFLDPQFESLPSAPRTVGIYTCHAIEQVHRLGSVLFDRLVTQFPNSEITGVHLEPIGSQMIGREDSRWAEFECERRYVEEKFYNSDLMEQIQRHPNLRVVTAEPRIFAHGDANTTSLVVWTRK